jgi:hypothetical protein
MDSKHSVTTGLVFGLVALAAFTGSRYLVKELGTERAVRTAADRFLDGSAFDDMTPYELVRTHEALEPTMFRRSFAAGAAVNIRRGLPGSRLRIAERAQVDDLGTAFRGVVDYSGTTPFDGDPPTGVQGEVRSYFHDDGGASIEALCLDEADACGPAYRRLIDAAEARLLQDVRSTVLTDVLPAGGDCETQQFEIPGQRRSVTGHFCIYDPGVVLVLTRLDRAGTLEALAAAAGDQDVLRAIRGTVRE